MPLLEELVREYGYLAIVVGTFFEGETIVLVAGFLAEQGYLDLTAVIACAFAGSYLGDQTWFFLGRRYGKALVRRWPQVKARVDQVMGILDRYATLWILSFRFVYGLRNISPVAIALGGIPAVRFALLNGVAAAVWAVAFGVAGYGFGAAVEVVFGGLAGIDERLLAVLGLVAAAVAAHAIARGIEKRRRARRAAESGGGGGPLAP
jgi:membrane protein DedA with SNARE-associated domain